MSEQNDWNRKREITQVLAKPIRNILEERKIDFKKLQELRLRVGQPLIVIQNAAESKLFSGEKQYLVTQEEVRETLDYVSHYSLYAFEYEMRQGYITIEGGHRVGMAGKVIMEGSSIKNIKYISSVNIRMSHEIIGCAKKIFPYASAGGSICHTLIISPPGCGKTTLLRDMIRQISDGNEWVEACAVGVVDERSEIGGCYRGIPQNKLGSRTDILDGCPKAEGMIMLIRSMGPKVIAVDEIGVKEDVHAVEYAMNCGCKLVTTVHGGSFEEIKGKPFFADWVAKKQFERYIVLGNNPHVGKVEGIYNQDGKMLWQE